MTNKTRAFDVAPPRLDHKGFNMVFDNGYTVSVMWHSESRSDQGETTARVWAWYKDDTRYGHPLGFQTPEQVLAYMNEVRALPVPTVVLDCTIIMIGNDTYLVFEDEHEAMKYKSSDKDLLCSFDGYMNAWKIG